MEEGWLQGNRKTLLYTCSVGATAWAMWPRQLSRWALGEGSPAPPPCSSLLKSHPGPEEARAARDLPSLGVRQALEPPGWRVELLRILKRLVCGNQGRSHKPCVAWGPYLPVLSGLVQYIGNITLSECRAISLEGSEPPLSLAWNQHYRVR